MSKQYLLRIICFIWIASNMVAAPGLSNTDDEKIPLITVQGYGSVKAVADTAYWALNLTFTDSHISRIKQTGQAIENAISSSLKKIENQKNRIELNKHHIEPVLNSDTRVNAYKYISQLILRTTDTANINSVKEIILSERLRSIINKLEVSGIEVKVKHQAQYKIEENIDKLESQALSKAYQNALAKIEALAQSGKLSYEIFQIKQIYSPRIKPYEEEFKQIPSKTDYQNNDNSINNQSALLKVLAKVVVKAKIIK